MDCKENQDLRVAVIMPTYNGERFIREQLESILNQSFERFKLYVFDDCSIDGTEQIIKDIEHQDSRLQYWVNDRQKGVIKNINDALRKVEADIYFLSDQDDIWIADKIEHQLKLLVESDALMTFSNLSLVDESGEPMGISFWENRKINPENAHNPDFLANDTIVTGCTMAFKKELLDYSLPIDKGATMHDHWLSFFAAFYGNVIVSDKETVWYRQHSNNAVGTHPSTSQRWKAQYGSSLTYRAMRYEKQSVLSESLSAIESFRKKLCQQKHTLPILDVYSRFYQSLLDRNWLKAFFLCLTSISRYGVAKRLKMFCTLRFFPVVYFVIRFRIWISSKR